MYNICPNCQSDSIEQTGKFDLTLVERTECRHDFECNDCGCLFQIVYEPVRTIIVQKPEAELDQSGHWADTERLPYMADE